MTLRSGALFLIALGWVVPTSPPVQADVPGERDRNGGQGAVVRNRVRERVQDVVHLAVEIRHPLAS